MGKSVRGWTTQRGASRQLREKTADQLRTPGNHLSVYDGTERAVAVRSAHTGTFVCPAMAPTGKSTVQERLQQPVERPPQRLEESLPFGRKPAPVLEAAKTLTRAPMHTSLHKSSHTLINQFWLSCSTSYLNNDICDDFSYLSNGSRIMCCEAYDQCACWQEELVAYESSEEGRSDQQLYTYTSDLQALEACTSETKSTLPVSATAITTPLQGDRWEDALSNHPDRVFSNYISTGIRCGFRVGLTTIRSYLSAIRHAHLERGLQDPLKGKTRLDLALKGFRRGQPRTQDARLPITPLILETIGRSLNGYIYTGTNSYWYGLHAA